jgi:hypothetical protein
MTRSTPLENRVAALISAYADRAATDVDPIAMTRIVAGSRYGNVPRLPFRSVGVWLGFAVVVMALLITIVAGALVAGGQLRRDPVPVIAQHARIHMGFIYIYGDGQVVFYEDHSGRLFERQLTQQGIDLVRSGAVDSSPWLTGLPESAWADPEYRPYAPSRYAICYRGMGEPIDASLAVNGLPASAQVLLRGKERTYDETDTGLGGWPPVACSEVTAEQAHVLVDLLAAAGFETGTNGPEPDFLDAGSDGGLMWPAPSGTATEAEVQDPSVSLTFQPILPHGSWVVWGG